VSAFDFSPRNRLTQVSFVLVGTFFLFMAVRYSATPSDPQKAVGYFFIALYSGFLAVLVRVFAGTLATLCSSSRKTSLLLACASAAIGLACVITVMVIFALRHPA